MTDPLMTEQGTNNRLTMEIPAVDSDTRRYQAFQRDGFAIVRNVVPPAQLSGLRDSVETLVARQRARDPDWDTCATPRTDLTQLADDQTRAPIEFALHDNVLEISAEMLASPAAAVALSAVGVLCNPERDPPQTPTSGQSWGTDPRNWHRDVRPDHDGPLAAILADEEANGPGYVQWNVALYDDAILYVVPGSHRRLTSNTEAMQLRQQGGTQSPLSDNVCVRLASGDGVVYNSVLLHWGSRYVRDHKRRTLQLGVRSFGRILPHQRACRLRERIRRVFPADSPSRGLVERSLALFENEFRVLEGLFRAVLEGDTNRFRADLAQLHPNPQGVLTCVIILTKLAAALFRSQPPKEGAVRPDSAHDADFDHQLSVAFRSRFDGDQRRQLHRRFEGLDAQLRCNNAQHVSGFLGPPTDYRFESLPVGMTLETAMATIFGSTSPP